MQNIFVNRKGFLPNSNMKTIKIKTRLYPNKTYIIGKNNLRETTKTNQKIITPEMPPLLAIPDNWNTSITIEDTTNNNILGNNCIFETLKTLHIPVAETTHEHLAFYNAQLYNRYDKVNITSPKVIPLTVTHIGENYVDGFLMNDDNGCYLEYHNTPHFHMPLNKQSKGYLILGKFYNNACLLSAFKIPYNSAIYTSPYTIHSDAFLIGSYLVAYTTTDEYSTVILKNNKKNSRIVISE